VHGERALDGVRAHGRACGTGQHGGIAAITQ
jgi:hypothetical protein